MDKLNFAVLGAGNGGLQMTADLTLRGFKVNLFELPRFEASIKPIKEKGGITMTAFGPGIQPSYPSGWKPTGFAKPHKITTDIGDALDDVDVVMIVTPAFGHEAMINACGPHLKAGQIVMFNTGNWACLRFANRFKKIGKDDVIFAETTLLLYSCRRSGPTSVHLDGIKEKLLIAALPAPETEYVTNKLKSAFVQFHPAENVLQTSLENLNLVFHPTLTICQAAHVERTKGEFIIYEYGTTKSVARVMEAVDRERIAVAKALHVKAIPAKDWLNRYYGAKGNDLYETIHDTKPYKDPIGGKGPSDLTFRYITEDVPYALVPLASMGDQLNVPTPTVKGLIAIASALNATDYGREGITAEKLGVAGLNAQQIIKRVS